MWKMVLLYSWLQSASMFYILDVEENDAEAYQSYISGMRNMASEIRNETNQPDFQCLVCG